MLDLDYSTNIDDVIDRLTELEKKHVPYALSRTINRLTYEGRDVVIDQLPRRFTIREKSLKASGGGRRALWVKPNNKSQPVIQSEIGTPFWFLEDQEVGGTRRGKSGEGRGFRVWGQGPGNPKRVVLRGALPSKRFGRILRLTGHTPDRGALSAISKGMPSKSRLLLILVAANAVFLSVKRRARGPRCRCFGLFRIPEGSGRAGGLRKQ